MQSCGYHSGESLLELAASGLSGVGASSACSDPCAPAADQAGVAEQNPSGAGGSKSLPAFSYRSSVHQEVYS